MTDERIAATAEALHPIGAGLSAIGMERIVVGKTYLPTGASLVEL